MPYSGVAPEDTAALESCVTKVMATGKDKSAAIAICRSSMNLSANTPLFIRWIEKFEYKPGQPFRVMPLGSYKRGERTLDITQKDLTEMASNYEANRPRWKIPIYAGHPTSEQPDPPKIGNVQKLEVHDDGLYAIPEYTADGQKQAEEGYQYVSPGVLWSKNGQDSVYRDEQGQPHDNVIDHVALTNRPFFGNATQLFSADVPASVIDKFMAGGELIYTLQCCIRACSACLTACRSMAGPEADACAKACADCLVECQVCLDACSGDASMPDMMAACKKCAEVCQACLTECLKCAVTADFDMSETCTKCAMACHECIEACQGNSESDEEKEDMSAISKVDNFKTYNTEQRAEMAKNGQALPNGSYPIADKGDLQDAIHAVGRGNTPHSTIMNHIIKRAKALGATDMLPPDWAGSTKEQAAQTLTEVETMADQATVVQPVIKPEEFAALKSKAEQFDAVKAQVELLAAENKKNAEMFAAEKKARRLDQLAVKYHEFSAIPVKADEFAAKMQALEDKDAELFKYMDGLIATLNATIEKSHLFDQFGSANPNGATDNFTDAVETELTKTFGGDRAKYGEAMAKVAKERPELAAEYKRDVATSGKAA